MNDVVGVRVFERVADLDGDRDHAREIGWASVGETWPRHQFHHEKREPACFADVVDRNDVWMIERRGCACFAHQALASI